MYLLGSPLLEQWFGSQLRAILLFGVDLSVSGDVFGFHIYWVEARLAAKHPTDANNPDNKELSIPKYQ